MHHDLYFSVGENKEFTEGGYC